MALLGKLDLTEQTDMAFGLEVFGTTESARIARLVIEGPEFEIACKCKFENGEVIASVPKLKGIMEAGVYDVRLDVVVGDKIFTPLKEQIELNPLVEFDVKTKKVEAIKEGVKVSVRNQVVSEDSKTVESGLEKHIQKAIKEGYEMSKVGEHYIMKKGELYAGLISENSILKSKRLYETLNALVDSLSLNSQNNQGVTNGNIQQVSGFLRAADSWCLMPSPPASLARPSTTLDLISLHMRPSASGLKPTAPTPPGN